MYEISDKFSKKPLLKLFLDNRPKNFSFFAGKYRKMTNFRLKYTQLDYIRTL